MQPLVSKFGLSVPQTALTGQVVIGPTRFRLRANVYHLNLPTTDRLFPVTPESPLPLHSTSIPTNPPQKLMTARVGLSDSIRDLSCKAFATC